MAMFVTRYDFRAPGADPQQRQELFDRSLEQAAYVDQLGQDALMLSEHHGSDDGYLPSPLLVASAFAALTRRIPISISALLVNLHDPVRLAEEIAILDHLTGGRVTYTLGLGYRREEYQMFGRDWADRGALMERNLAVLLAAWRGEEVDVDGVPVRVTPTPFSQPHPFLFYGGGSVAAARRAAAFGLHFQPQNADAALAEAYREACRSHGREPGIVMQPPAGPANVFCAAAPDEFWERWGQHLLADAQGYQAWRAEGAVHHVSDESTTVEEMRAAGVYVVLTPDELIARIETGEISLVASHPACGGLPTEPSWTSLRLICETVMPAVRG
ncbi:LLM class flavin-dependent oxidoreductase [Nocardioides limicola]|uniref:LLM class flavin-dependent oxidoreductase n=1 Tax=Nocardioides limicola TaxID=2803368 RepID=UPI00193C1F3F|nr:LLM class flavin-dependent oxidoreductase [Nocardioides sp. DJM-14]